jgi:noranthrone synthase
VLQSALDKGIRQRGGKPTSTPSAKASPPVVQPRPAAVPSQPDNAPAPPPAAAVPVTTTTAPKAGGANDEKIQQVLKVISEESGVALEELTDDSNFADMGIDSLNSMVIGSRLREDLGMDLDPDFSLFVDCSTVRSLKDYLGGSSESAPDGGEAEEPTAQPGLVDPPTASKLEEFLSSNSSNTSDHSSASSDAGSGSSRSSEPDDTTRLQLKPYCRPTTSVILQGLPRVAKKTLFMLPDGGGSASSYVPIPRLKSDIAMVGLNCPYARDPENMDCTHTAMIESFCNEIRRRQPKGPYHLGGWSSGGAFAYVTAEALVNQGEEVHSLIVIDAPVPQVMEKLPKSFYEHCNSVGLFANQPGGSNDGTSEPPPYLIPHFVVVVDVMLDYKVAALNTDRMPKVGIVWASETVMEEEHAPKIKGMHFMVQKRTDFGPDGWDTVLPGAEFDIVRADGANHFTLMVSH